ncbi:MAG: N-acetylmuramoyl-L-alanine amidase [Bacillaceae bacterium]|nr:N-acetylmuramoyl-L-alanine amidase [Bacillaceae bacterium]
MTIIVIDPGHGGSDPGATHQGVTEKEIVLAIGLRVRDYLEENYITDVIMTRTTDQTVSLSERVRIANRSNANYFCSIHSNAGGGTGFESYIFNDSVPQRTIQKRSTIHDHIMDSIGEKYAITDRGKKRTNFHVLRETNMSASLLEILFVDNARDLQLLRNDTFISDVSKAIADGIAQALSLERKENQETILRVIAGAFKNKDNTNARIQLLQDNGISSILTTVEVNGERLYRVQAGAFTSRENADRLLETIKSLGISDAYILTVQPSPPAQAKPVEQQEKGPSILGTAQLTGAELDQFVRNVHPNAPLLGQYYIHYGKEYGIKSDIAFAQALHETNYFRFTGVVKKEQNNFAGIGATGNTNQGAHFATPEEGVHAHIQHLYAYASTDPTPNQFPQVSPRFDLVQRGSATTWIGLNGKWAVPGTTYGQSILRLYISMVEFSIREMNKRKQTLEQILNDIEF